MLADFLDSLVFLYELLHSQEAVVFWLDYALTHLLAALYVCLVPVCVAN